MASIVVAGDVLRRPRGSNLATHLHYLIGLRKLGHEVPTSRADGGDAVGGAAGGDRAAARDAAPLPRRRAGRVGRPGRRSRRRHALVAASPQAGKRRPAARHRRALLARRALARTPPGAARHRHGHRRGRRDRACRGLRAGWRRGSSAALGAGQLRPLLLLPPRILRARRCRLAADDPAGRAAALVRTAHPHGAAAAGAAGRGSVAGARRGRRMRNLPRTAAGAARPHLAAALDGARLATGRPTQPSSSAPASRSAAQPRSTSRCRATVAT